MSFSSSLQSNGFFVSGDFLFSSTFLDYLIIVHYLKKGFQSIKLNAGHVNGITQSIKLNDQHLNGMTQGIKLNAQHVNGTTQSINLNAQHVNGMTQSIK